MAEHAVSRPIYFAVFGTLIVLTALTTWIAFHDLGRLNPIVALTIAAVKATLVALFFMHLKHASRLNWVVVTGALLWLFILFALTLADYLTRGWAA